MQIVEPYAKMIGPVSGIALLQHVEWCGRISHRSEDAQTEFSFEKFLRSVVLGHGDWSITEHASVSVDSVVDRGITHEWVRHRIGAYTQESTRFVNYARKNTTIDEFVNPAKFICPPSILATRETESCHVYERWCHGREEDESEYMFLVSHGIKAQEARSCFPNALAARLVATYNLRNWRHFFLMRTTREAHPQMRQVAIPLLLEFQAKIPVLYEDIEPEAKQSDNMKKMR